MSAPTQVLSAAGGQVLAGVMGLVTALRHGSKPLHPRGVVIAATLDRTGADERFGSAWLDEVGSDEVTVRLSRSVGLPAGAPDVLGLTLRFGAPGDEHDLLLGSAGWSPVTRHVPLPARDPMATTYTSVFPYESATGRVVLGARPGGPLALELHVARVGGPWQPFGRLRLHAHPDQAQDARLTVDPVVHPLPGLQLPRAVVALREPSYRLARRMRGDRAA